MKDLIKILVLLAWIPGAEWNIAISLGDIKQCFYGDSLYTDPVTDTSFFLACGKSSDDSTYGIQTINPDRTLGDFTPFGDISSLSDFDPSIQGAGDGKRLFLVETRRRSRNSECKVGDTTGCTEVIFRESETAGKSWGPPVKISRKDMEDVAGRWADSSVFIKETGVHYLFYTYFSYATSQYSIGFVTRMPGEKYFGDEKLVLQGAANFSGEVRAAYTYSNSIATMHLVWTSNGGNITYTNSTDMINWASPVYIGYMSSTEKYMRFMSNPSVSGTTLHVAYVLSGAAFIISSVNEGYNWTRPMKLTDASTIADIYTTYCGVNAEQRVLALGSGVSDRKFYIYDPIRGTIKQGSSPFSTVGPVYLPLVTCVPQPLAISVKAAARKTADDRLTYMTGSTILYSYAGALKPGLIGLALLLIALLFGF